MFFGLFKTKQDKWREECRELMDKLQTDSAIEGGKGLNRDVDIKNLMSRVRDLESWALSSDKSKSYSGPYIKLKKKCEKLLADNNSMFMDNKELLEQNKELLEENKALSKAKKGGKQCFISAKDAKDNLKRLKKSVKGVPDNASGCGEISVLKNNKTLNIKINNKKDMEKIIKRAEKGEIDIL